jgi:hypothetical protein
MHQEHEGVSFPYSCPSCEEFMLLAVAVYAFVAGTSTFEACVLRYDVDVLASRVGHLDNSC